MAHWKVMQLLPKVSMWHMPIISQTRLTSTLCIVTNTHTHTRLTALCPGLPGWAGTRKVQPIWILLKQETVSGSGISWAICKSAPHSRQITMPAPHHSSFFYRPDALPAAQPTASKHWRQLLTTLKMTLSGTHCVAWRHRLIFSISVIFVCVLYTAKFQCAHCVY